MESSHWQKGGCHRRPEFWFPFQVTQTVAAPDPRMPHHLGQQASDRTPAEALLWSWDATKPVVVFANLRQSRGMRAC